MEKFETPKRIAYDPMDTYQKTLDSDLSYVVQKFINTHRYVPLFSRKKNHGN
jgi:hypothetical protein